MTEADDPKFETLLQFLRESDTLVVTRIDRLARNMRDLQNLVHDLGRRGVALKATEQPIDTSMAFTPTAGLVMGTRPGDLDPGLLVYLMRAAGLVDTHPTELELHKYFLVRFLVLPIMFGLAIILVFVFGSLWPARSVAFAAPVVQFLLAARQMARGASGPASRKRWSRSRVSRG